MGSFAKSSRWCHSYLEICRRLWTLADALPESGAKAMLKRRVGQIALSIAKNIPAYRLPPDVAKEARDFAKAHRKELSGYALGCGDWLVMAQGALMRLSLDWFLKVYSRK